MLFVCFYFPPAGGGGVQRPLKLAGLLPELGIETYLLAPTDPKWIHCDPDLRPPSLVSVYRSRYPGPRGRQPAEELYGLAGVNRLVRRLALFPRRLLLPDENVSWALTAIPAAIRLVRRERIDVVLTSSPPSSVHLIGAAVRRATRVAWVADLRDSMVAKEDRRVESRAVLLKEKSHRAVARLIARSADAIVAVTPSIAGELEQLGARRRPVVIANGCDFDDFTGLEYQPGDRFRITHTGSFFGRRSPRAFLSALASSADDVVARFVGDFRQTDRNWARRLDLGDRLEFYPFLPHRRVLELQRDSEALLLLLPNVGARGRDVPSGKLFEYLAAGRPILAAVPPDGAAAQLIRDTNSGLVVAPDDEPALAAALDRLVEEWRQHRLESVELTPELRRRLSRRTRAEELAALFKSL